MSGSEMLSGLGYLPETPAEVVLLHFDHPCCGLTRRPWRQERSLAPGPFLELFQDLQILIRRLGPSQLVHLLGVACQPRDVPKERQVLIGYFAVRSDDEEEQKDLLSVECLEFEKTGE